MSAKKKFLAVWLAIGLGVMSCGLFPGESLSELESLQTSVAETVTAVHQERHEAEIILPTLTVAPTSIPQQTPTPTPRPCNEAQFISETVPDGTEFNVDESFNKTWRLRNTGTCTWNTNYQVVFYSGEKMSGPTTKNLPQPVAPGEQVDISVDLKAPGTAGTYKGTWRIQDDQGQIFVHNIWVEITAKAILGSPPMAMVDLSISEFSLFPPIPTMGENVYVRVRATNLGSANSGAFKTEWYGLSTYVNPSCSWDILGGLAAGANVLLECNFSFPSWYPINKTTVAYVDIGNLVSESNEDNNTASISPFGVTP